jgi:glycosyltransferase involved in cell wall biosynthesis
MQMKRPIQPPSGKNTGVIMPAKHCPLVTIAIPTYNRADGFLRQALATAVGQSYRNIEIIVSDNCSIDDTESIVRSFHDSRIRYFRQDRNIGANNNFNFCLSQARGEFFLLLQDDDYIDADFLEACVSQMTLNPGRGIIRTGTRIINGRGDVICESPNMVEGLPTADFFLGWFSGKTSLYLCSTLFNTKRLVEIGGFRSPRNLFQDDMAIVRLAAQYGRADIRAVKANFRRHEGEMTASSRVSDWCEDSVALLDLMCELVSYKDKIDIHEKGMSFFAKVNYNRAGNVKSPLKRVVTYFMVFRKFHYRHLPGMDNFLSPLYSLIHGTAIYYGLRFIKRKISHMPSKG